MKSRKRPFQRGILNHCYQRSADGGVIFYSLRDYLVWFTIVCCTARKYGVSILALAPMPDHVHLSVIANRSALLSKFIGVYSHDFALEYNKISHRKGPIFKHPFGSAPKYGAKKGRANLIYVCNNAVERQLAAKAEQYRWSFVAYAVNKCPFSEEVIVRRSSRPLQRVIKEIDACRAADRPLSYRQLERLFSKLSPGERQQLTDYIITAYNAIDFAAALEFFDNSYENFLSALHSTTGSEYDLNEVLVGKDDRPYAQMVKILLVKKNLEDIHDFLSWDERSKYDLFLLLRKYTFVMGAQIAKFLHMSLKEANPACGVEVIDYQSDIEK